MKTLAQAHTQAAATSAEAKQRLSKMKISKSARKPKVSTESLLAALDIRFQGACSQETWSDHRRRLERHVPDLITLLHKLYGRRKDFARHVEEILVTATEMWLKRPGELKAMDASRTVYPYWYRSHRMIGATCYADLFAGNLKGLSARIPYLTEMGITYLHLMPLFASPPDKNDGGYAVSSYREVDSRFGTMEDLSDLASRLRNHNISLALDFVFNHTSSEHEWAKKARAGDPHYQAFYRMYPDRAMPDAFERTLPEIFPDEHAGAFTFDESMGKWVWTTFHSYQWDLNYENPDVFRAMTGEMLFLANQGVDVLRLDAVAFLWKRMGTSCQNLGEAHTIIRAFNAIARIAAPSLIFLSEAIVHPDDVMKYVSERECHLSYNPELMALLWEALATRKVGLLSHALKKRPRIAENCSWLNYIRCHDDIGWAFSDQDARDIGVNPKDHRRFLSDFYTNRFEGSFARGLPFQDNPATGDCRVSGTTASLCGLEKGVEAGDEREIDIAIRRILLLHGILLTIGGMPQFYLGDEIGTLNDHAFRECPGKAEDTRWAHRIGFDAGKAERRFDPTTVEGRVYQGLLHLIQLRQRNPVFARSTTEIVDTGSEHVFGYRRREKTHSLVMLANFADYDVELPAGGIELFGMGSTLADLVSGRVVDLASPLTIEPCRFMVLLGQHSTS